MKPRTDWPTAFVWFVLPAAFWAVILLVAFGR